MNQTLPGSQIVQVAWVVKDVRATEKFFIESLGVEKFDRIDNFRVQGTMYGKPTEWESHLSMAYFCGQFIELIQPLSDVGIFADWLKKNPAGGVQHIAYRLPEAELDNAVSEMVKKGYPVIMTADTPVARIVILDTYKDLGIATELMGVTPEGVAMIENMKK